jgi:hypothetical protein
MTPRQVSQRNHIHIYHWDALIKDKGSEKEEIEGTVILV